MNPQRIQEANDILKETVALPENFQLTTSREGVDIEYIEKGYNHSQEYGSPRENFGIVEIKELNDLTSDILNAIKQLEGVGFIVKCRVNAKIGLHFKINDVD